MTKSKKLSKKSQKETTLVKIAGAMGEIAGRLANQKDHLVEMTGNAIDSAKTLAHDISTKKLPAVKKAFKSAKKKAVKRVSPLVKKAKKVASPKKIASAKKSVLKSAKVVKKAVKKSTKKR